MKPYLTFSAEDFACDEDFLNWIKYPDHYPDLHDFWNNWLLENPHKQSAVEEARCLVLSMAAEKQFLAAEGTQKKVWERIVFTTNLPESKTDSTWPHWYRWAAVLFFMAGAGWVGFSTKTVHAPLASVTNTDPEYVTHINNSDAPKTIVLSDGTSIQLQPESLLEYPRAFTTDIRQVHLTGQAFFQVTRDPARPFLVQAGEIVTRVLGTSFTVRNFEGEENVVVKVKTGKVSVFMASEMSRPSENSEKAIEGVVLTPNQQVVFERLEMKMTKSLVENPSLLIPLARKEFEFVDAPIGDVFAAIEQAYGVDIVFDAEALSSCLLNASLADVALYDKLSLICRGINATYEIIDSHIIIYGKGCDEKLTDSNPA